MQVEGKGVANERDGRNEKELDIMFATNVTGMMHLVSAARNSAERS